MTATTLHLPRGRRHPARVPATRRARQILSTVALAAAATAYIALVGPTLGAPPLGRAGFAEAGIAAGPAVTATHVDYITDPADAARILAVRFDVEPPVATTARIQLAAGGAWYACTVRAGAATCPTPEPVATFAGLTRLAVEAR